MTFAYLFVLSVAKGQTDKDCQTHDASRLGPKS